MGENEEAQDQARKTIGGMVPGGGTSDDEGGRLLVFDEYQVHRLRSNTVHVRQAEGTLDAGTHHSIKPARGTMSTNESR